MIKMVADRFLGMIHWQCPSESTGLKALQALADPTAVQKQLAASQGLEPRLKEPESLVLPLHHEAVEGGEARIGVVKINRKTPVSNFRKGVFNPLDQRGVPLALGGPAFFFCFRTIGFDVLFVGSVFPKAAIEARAIAS